MASKQRPGASVTEFVEVLVGSLDNGLDTGRSLVGYEPHSTSQMRVGLMRPRLHVQPLLRHG